MNESEKKDLLNLVINTVEKAGKAVSGFGYAESVFSFSYENSKEIKAVADSVLEEIILDELRLAEISVLSEESGECFSDFIGDYQFIVDPLDGTFNYLNNLGPCAISIGLWGKSGPVLGAVFDISNKQLYYGGGGLGAFTNKSDINVSSISEKSEAVICTGFPVSMDLDNDEQMSAFWNSIKLFSKVRMIGSASMSLINVARGSADAYMERDIMIWDVAAGLAIVSGAGGKIEYTRGRVTNSLFVKATNNKIII